MYLVKCHIECILYLNMVVDLFMSATSRTQVGNRESFLARQHSKPQIFATMAIKCLTAFLVDVFAWFA